MFHLDDFGAGLAAHYLDGVLVAEVVGSLDGVVGMIAPIVACVFKGGVDSALGGVGMATDGVDLGYDGDIRAILASG